jgi:hypothetical protein
MLRARGDAAHVLVSPFQKYIDWMFVAASLPQKNCDFDTLGKMLHRVRKWIAALLCARSNHAELVTGSPNRTVDKSPRHSIDGRGFDMTFVESNLES